MTSEFLDLFFIFAGSDFFTWVSEVLGSFCLLYSALTLVGGILHGKPV